MPYERGRVLFIADVGEERWEQVKILAVQQRRSVRAICIEAIDDYLLNQREEAADAEPRKFGQ
jgi:hypothetical protein